MFSQVVFAHGSFSSASCVSCGEAREVERVRRELLEDQDPKCDSCGGLVKPDLVFFGEALPERFLMHQEDLIFSDYLICMGTSLEVRTEHKNKYG